MIDLLEKAVNRHAGNQERTEGNKDAEILKMKNAQTSRSETR